MQLRGPRLGISLVDPVTVDAQQSHWAFAACASEPWRETTSLLEVAAQDAKDNKRRKSYVA